MPEYLAPGVYIEEVSFRNKSIEGVSTSVTGMVGPTRYGPVGGVPELLTSATDFERIYGGLDPLQFDGLEPQSNFLALAVRQFFDNGGTKLFVTRVHSDPSGGTAKKEIAGGPTLKARFPGSGGNMTVFAVAQLSQNLVSGGAPNLVNIKEKDVVFVADITVGGRSGFYETVKGAGSDWRLTNPTRTLAEADIAATTVEVYKVSLQLSVRRAGRFEIEEPLGNFPPGALATAFVENPTSRARFLTQPFFVAGVPASDAVTAEKLLGGAVPSALSKLALPGLLKRSVTDLLTLTDPYLTNLGFVPATLRAWSTSTLTLTELRNLAQTSLEALKLGKLKGLSASNLKTITDATDKGVIRDLVNLSLLAQRTQVALTELTLGLLESLGSLTALGLNKANLTAFDPKAITLTELLTLSDPALTRLEIPALRGVTLDTIKTGVAPVAADVTTIEAAIAPVTLANMAEADFNKLTLAHLQNLTAPTLLALGFDAAATTKLKAVGHSAIAALTLADVLTLPATVLNNAGLSQAGAVTLEKLNALGAPDKQKVANALGIVDTSGLKDENLVALTLATLIGLKKASLTQAGFVGEEDDIRALTMASLQALTLAEWRTLGETVLEKVGAGVLKQIEAILPLRSSDLRSALTLEGGTDGTAPTANDYKGKDPAVATGVKTGLHTFTDIEDISIVAAPGSSYSTGADTKVAQGVALELITHCEQMRYRVAVLDMPNARILSEARTYRAVFDSKYAAIYYPWVTVLDPMDTTGRSELQVPPSGFVTGIYARNDGERGVSKAPANEVLRGAINLELLLNKSQQDLLNPDGIDCFRSFPGRGIRLWGARTISSDAEWKYVNVRRYFAYLEHSIDKGTQFAVFENNNERLWDIVRSTIEDFLFSEWRNKNLMGTRPQEAFKVRCDRSTMTQNDIDNGRLVCEIGVAVNKPAEFVIFRIGQMTADSKS